MTPTRRHRPVVVGIDGSPDARRSLVLATEIALERSAELVIVHAVGLTDVVDGERVVSEGHTSEIAARFDEWCRAAIAAGAEAWTAELRDGNPVDVLLRVAHDVDAELIVVGRHGAGRRPELLLGSTAHQVAERAVVPVLIIPPVGRATRVESG